MKLPDYVRDCSYLKARQSASNPSIECFRCFLYRFHRTRQPISPHRKCVSMLKRMTIYDHSYIRLSLDIIEFLVTCGNSKDRRRPLIPMRQKKIWGYRCQNHDDYWAPRSRGLGSTLTLWGSLTCVHCKVHFLHAADFDDCLLTKYIYMYIFYIGDFVALTNFGVR